MVYRTYGRIPNLTRQDGSAFERQYTKMAQKVKDTIGHNPAPKPPNYLILLIEKWWRRRESNPRPKTFHMGIYMFIPNFACQPSRPFRARSSQAYPD